MARFTTALAAAAALMAAAAPAAADTVRHALGTTLVAPPLAAPWSGAPHGPAELTAASSTLTSLLVAEPGETGSAPWIARTTLELSLRFRFGEVGEIRLPAEFVFPAGAVEPLDSGLPPPGPLGGGAGVGVAVSPELGGGAYLGFLFELLLLAVPNDVVELCQSACEPGSFSRSTGTGAGVLLRGGVLAGWKSGGWRAWGGVSFSNQPGGIDDLLSDPRAPAAIPFGTGFAVVVAGGEYRVVESLALFVAVQQPVAFCREGPWHGPILTGGVHACFPDL